MLPGLPTKADVSITPAPTNESKTRQEVNRRYDNLIKGALSRRFCCILVKTAQIFDEKLFC